MAKTIAAVATPLSTGGISVIRISGDRAIETADKVFFSRSGQKLSEKLGYTASYGSVRLNDMDLDDAVALVFRAPKSYTGEDVVEISCHGGICVTREVLRAILESGAEPAQAGEFTKRAFLNGKMNLTQAEAVAEIIHAKNTQAMNAARSQMKGSLSRKIEQLEHKLLVLSGHLAAWIDYPEDDISEVDEEHLLISFQELLSQATALLDGFDTGRMVREGIHTVIAGKPNVGKSTLMNLLAGCERSIVTDIAGTTRDVVEETVKLGDVLLRLSDTAGIHETEDRVEQVGVERARDYLLHADLILAVFDGSHELDRDDRALLKELEQKDCIIVINKCDLEMKIEEELLRQQFHSIVLISALDSSSIGRLEEAVKEKKGLADLDTNAAMLFTDRQRSCMTQVISILEEGRTAIMEGMTLDAVSVCIDSALESLFSLTGKRVTEEVVNQVFHNFCVGK